MGNTFTLKLRKFVATLSLTTLLASMLVVPQASGANLDEAPSWARNAVEELADLSQSSLRLNDATDKCEFSKMLTVAFGLEEETLDPFTFTDVPEWAKGYVGAMVNNEIAKGDSATKFGCGAPMSRAVQVKMIVNALGLEEGTLDSKYDSEFAGVEWAKGAFAAALTEGIVKGDDSTGALRPAANANRAESFVLAYRAMGGDESEGEEETAKGGLTVSLASGSPAGLNIPAKASSVELLRFDVKASSEGPVTVDAITVHKTGISDVAAGFQGYLYEGSERLTAGKSLNSDSETMSFRNLAMTLKAGETRTLSVRADIGDTATTGDIALEITEVESSAASLSGVTLKGGLNSLSTTEVGTITVEDTGSIEDPQVGQQDAIIAKFKVTAGTNDALVKELGVYLAGTVSTEAVENFELYVAGDEKALASVATVNSKDVATFVLSSPLTIEDGDTKTFTVKADFNTGRNGDTVQVYIDEETDVFAIDEKYGFGMDAVITSYDGSDSTKRSDSTLEGGDVTITSNGPAARDISTNAKDVKLMNFSVAAASDVTFKNFAVALTGSESSDTTEGLLNGTVSNLTDIKVLNVDTGKTLLGPVDADSFVDALGSATEITEGAGDNAQAFYTFTDEFEIEAGKTLNLALTADVANTSTLDGMTVVPAVAVSSTVPEVRDVNNKIVTNSTDLVPSATITGKTATITSSSLTFSLASSPVSDSFVKGSADVTFACYSVRAAQGSDVKITDLTLTSSFDEDNDATYSVTGTDNAVAVNSVVSSVGLYGQDGSLLAARKSVSSDGTVVFENIAIKVAGGETRLVCVKGNISSDAYKNSTVDKIAFGIAATSDVTAEKDGEGTNLSTGQISGATDLNEGTTAPNVVVTVTDGGTLVFSVDASTAKEDIAVAGATGVAVSKFRLTSTDEAFVVRELSVNNRQSAVTAASIGNYDNNVVGVKLTYTNSAGVTETKSGFLTNGTAQFSGLDIFVPQDEDVTLTVAADLNTIQAGATAGEYIDFNLAFNNLDALAVGSNETYDFAQLDAGDADVSLGTITFTSGSEVFELEGAQDKSAVALGGSTTIVVDNGSGNDNTNRLPIGGLFCADDNNGDTCSSEDIYVVTAFTAGTVTDTYTVQLVDDAGDGSYDDEDQLMYALPGSGYLTNSNRMHVYEALPSLTLSSSSPSGDRNVDSTDSAFKFDITEKGGKEKVRVRASVDYTTCDAGTGTTLTTAANTAVSVDGSACEVTAVQTAGDSFGFVNSADLSAYGYVSFWFRWQDDDANLATLLPAEIRVFTADADDGTEDQETTLSSANVVGAPSYFVEDTWYHVRDVAMPTGSDSNDVYIGLSMQDADTMAAGDDVFVDRFRVYNERLVVDIRSDADFDRTNDQSTSAAKTPVVAYLKDGSTTIATGYVDVLAVDAGADGAEDSTDGSTASIFFVPTSSEGDMEVSKGTTKNYTVQLSTENLISEDPGVDDPVTFSIDYGSSSDGTVTAGDFWWNETNAIVKWLGHTASTKLSGSTVNY